MSAVPNLAVPLAPAVFLLNSLIVGGTERKVVAVANALHRRGRSVHLAYLNQPQTLLPELDAGVPTLWLQRKGKFDLGAARRLAGYCREHGIRQIFCLNEYPTLYGSLACRLLGNGCQHTAFINTTILPNRKAELKMLVYAPLFRRTPRLVFGCREQLEAWADRYRLDRARCDFIYNGIDAQRFDPANLPASARRLRATLGWSEQDVVVGMVGQLLPKKGYPDLLAALARLRADDRPVKGLIVGAGPEEARLRALAASLHLDQHVVFAGQLGDVRPALAAMDVFALTSVAVETFSNAALEAMAMRLPVVLSRIGGAAEMVLPDRSGFLYPAGDVAALVERLRPLVDSPELRQSLGAAARRQVLARFSAERMVDQYEQLLPTLAPQPN